MRYDATEQLLGKQALTRVRTAKVLVVGAGGIGCELLKELVLAGFGELHVVDLDTIDLSNLNRQFLFSRQHVKQSKAVVACSVAQKFNPDVHLVPYVGNIITDSEVFSVKWFRSFDIAFNALDNAEARRHVNRMCVSTSLPLIDCGSAGFAGQVQVILPQKSECYDCRSHPAPKSFPVCTIRSTPSQPIHCVVWSKSFLFSLLFGPEQVSEEPENEDGEDAAEIEQLHKESNELADLKNSLREPDFMQRLVDKVYVADIHRLLMAKQLWQDAARAPKPLTVDMASVAPVNPADLDDQHVWSVDQALGVLKHSTAQLIARLDTGIDAIEFDKDDEVTLDFVVAATIIRSHIFSIPQRSKFEIKQMAGNIIPAVATTNAIVSGLGVVEALKVLSGEDMQSNLRDVNIFRSSNSALLGDKLQPPSPTCPVSSCARTTVHAAPSTTLDTLIEQVLKLKLGYDEVSLVTDKLLYDPDFDDQASRTLAELHLVDKFITVVDEDDRRVNLELYISEAADLEVDDVRIPLKQNVKRGREEDNAEEEAPGTMEINADGDIVLD